MVVEACGYRIQGGPAGSYCVYGLGIFTRVFGCVVRANASVNDTDQLRPHFFPSRVTETQTRLAWEVGAFVMGQSGENSRNEMVIHDRKGWIRK